MESYKVGKGAIISNVSFPIEEYIDLMPTFNVKSCRKIEKLKGFDQIKTQRIYL